MPVQTGCAFRQFLFNVSTVSAKFTGDSFANEDEFLGVLPFVVCRNGARRARCAARGRGPSRSMLGAPRSLKNALCIACSLKKDFLRTLRVVEGPVLGMWRVAFEHLLLVEAVAVLGAMHRAARIA